MVDVSELIGRIEAATGPDRETDIDLCIALNYLNCIDDAPLNLRRAPDDPGWLDYEFVQDGKSVECTDEAPALTASIDSALALVERCLPDHQWGVGSAGIRSGAHPDGNAAYVDGFRAHVTKRSPLRPMPVVGTARTAPLAILSALLRALEEKEPSNARS